MSANEKPTIGVVGVGWVGLVTAACFAELGHPVVAMDIDAAKVDVAEPRRGADPRAGPSGAARAQPRAAALHDRDGRACSSAARLLFCCVDTPPTYSGDADLSRVAGGRRGSCREDGEHALVMKSTVPAGTGRGDPARQARPRLRLLPRVPQGGLGGRGLHASRPRRDRRRSGRRVGRRRGRRGLRAARRRARAHRRRLAPR